MRVVGKVKTTNHLKQSLRIAEFAALRWPGLATDQDDLGEAAHSLNG